MYKNHRMFPPIMNKSIKYLPLELYGYLYEVFRGKKFAKNFLPSPYHVRVLCYHDIPKDNIPLFEKQIEFLKREFRVINAEQLRDFFLGRNFLPDVNVFLTFDDGSTDQYYAAETLDRHKIQGCFFVNTADREERFILARPNSKLPPMTWDQIRDLHRRGHVIGSHGDSHFNLSTLQPIEIRDELVVAKTKIEKEIGEQVDFFAFPYGTAKELSQEALLIAKKYYDFNFTFLPGKNHFASANRFLIQRTGIGPRYSLPYVRALMLGLKDWRKRNQIRFLSNLIF
jgi:peptidoglycan/xylan/chitin deacetylase (PgdA/CDA1 family)